MRKALTIYVSILIGLFAVLYSLGLKGNYVIEKKIWRLYQQQLDIAKDPAVIPDRTFDDVTGEYRKIINKYPDSGLTPALYIRLGETYALKKDYGKARDVFDEILSKYPDNKELSAEAMFKIGKTYELEEDWIKASKIYNTIISDYSGTNVAMDVPLYIANYYRKLNDFEKTLEAYEVALRYYNKIAFDRDNTQVGLTALRYLSNCYLEQNRWGEAVSTLGLVIEKYSASGFMTLENTDMTIKTINIISAYQIKNYDTAINLYRGIIKRNPEHRLNGYLEQVIDAFNQLRKEGVDAENLK